MNKSIFSINSLSKYSELFQIVGVIGLIASLIFVGLELRQSHKIALSDQQQARMQAFVTIYNNATSNNIAFAYDQNHYSDYEIFYHNMLHSFWNISEADFLRYRLGLMDENIWRSKFSIIKRQRSSDARNCELRRRVWQIKRTQIDSEFVKLVEEIPFEECKKL